MVEHFGGGERQATNRAGFHYRRSSRPMLHSSRLRKNEARRGYSSFGTAFALDLAAPDLGVGRAVQGLPARFRAAQAHFSLDSYGTNRPGQQIPHPHQVVRRGRKGEYPAHLFDAAMPDLAHHSDRLQPAKAFFHALALPLADLVTAMPRR